MDRHLEPVGLLGKQGRGQGPLLGSHLSRWREDQRPLHRGVAEAEAASQSVGIQHLKAIDQHASLAAGGSDLPHFLAFTIGELNHLKIQIPSVELPADALLPARQGVDCKAIGGQIGQIGQIKAPATDVVDQLSFDGDSECPAVTRRAVGGHGSGAGDAITAIAETQLKGLTELDRRHFGICKALLPLQRQWCPARGLVCGLECEALQLRRQQSHGEHPDLRCVDTPGFTIKQKQVPLGDLLPSQAGPAFEGHARSTCQVGGPWLGVYGRIATGRGNHGPGSGGLQHAVDWQRLNAAVGIQQNKTAHIQ